MKKLSQNLLQFDTKMASLGRLKLPTVCLEGRCSIQLSYKDNLIENLIVIVMKLVLIYM